MLDGSNGEEEIIISPFLPITIEEIEKTDTDWSVLHDLDGNIPTKKIIRILPQEEIKPLSQEEDDDKNDLLEILYDENIHSEAIAFLEDCKKYKAMKDALKEIDPERVKKYLKWKDAFQKVYRYLYRESILDVKKTQMDIKKYMEEKATQTRKKQQQGKLTMNSVVSSIAAQGINHIGDVDREKNKKTIVPTEPTNSLGGN